MLARLWKPAIFLFVAVNLWLLLFGKTYVYTAVLHQAPNIDDLDLFPLRTVAASTDASPWPKALDYNQGEYPAALTRVLEEFGTTQFLVIQNG